VGQDKGHLEMICNYWQRYLAGQSHIIPLLMQTIKWSGLDWQQIQRQLGVSRADLELLMSRNIWAIHGRMKAYADPVGSGFLLYNARHYAQIHFSTAWPLGIYSEFQGHINVVAGGSSEVEVAGTPGVIRCFSPKQLGVFGRITGLDGI
jgi:hypothetical protein